MVVVRHSRSAGAFPSQWGDALAETGRIAQGSRGWARWVYAYREAMKGEPRTRRKPIRTGLGILLLILGLHGVITTLIPMRGYLRPANEAELAAMLFVDLSLLCGGIYLVVEGVSRGREADRAEE